MSVGFIMLVHTRLDRAAQIASHWAGTKNPVVIHVDSRTRSEEVTAFKAQLADNEYIRFCTRHTCEWGRWSMIAATQSAAEMMLAEFPQVDHVFLASGSCLPLRHIEDLEGYLAVRPETDFIESVTTDEVDWTIGGLNVERFTLRFPFSWKRHRYLFDRYVDLQRKLNVRRDIPVGLEPHLGSQWWCLTKDTLSAILNDPRRDEFDAYFKKVWIPDESYFQTLVRVHSKKIESRSLTLAKFDIQGKPYLFYDDHSQLLRKSDCFVARKIWHGADLLYREFLENTTPTSASVEPNPMKIDRLFSRAADRRLRGRPGLYMQSRFPDPWRDYTKTCSRYSVFQGFTHLFEDFEAWLARRTGHRLHGNLFAPDKVHFSGGQSNFSGALTDSASLRDYNPEAFLANLVWNTRGEHQCFQFDPADAQRIIYFLAADRNAQISVISGAWAIPLSRSEESFDEIKRRAAWLQRAEAQFLQILRQNDTRARVHIWSLAEFIEGPMENLQFIIDELGGKSRRQLTEVPEMADLSAFSDFLQKLKNEGMNPHVVGEFPSPLPASVPQNGQRPYLVK